MKKILLTTVSALAFLAMVAAPGADKKDRLQTQVSRNDCVSQAEMMFSNNLDGFGLDAEEYELLMSQDFDMMDDMSMTFIVPTCAGGDGTRLNGAGAGGWQDQPIIRITTHGFAKGDETNGGLDGHVNGGGAGGDGTRLNGAGAGGWQDQPIIRITTHGFVKGDETNGGLDGLVNGGGAGGDGTQLNGGSRGGWSDQPIRPRIK